MIACCNTKSVPGTHGAFLSRPTHYCGADREGISMCRPDHNVTQQVEIHATLVIQTVGHWCYLTLGLLPVFVGEGT